MINRTSSEIKEKTILVCIGCHSTRVTKVMSYERHYAIYIEAFCVVSFLKGPNTIYSVGLVLGYQYIVQGQKKSMTTQKALLIAKV